MNTLSRLDRLNLDPTAKTQVAAIVQTLLEQAKQDAAALQAKDAEIQFKDQKIQALTHELAHIRRIRYGVKSEALPPLQRDVFEETVNTDLAAIEAEIERLTDARTGTAIVKAKRPRAGRQPLPEPAAHRTPPRT
jgi:transposase